jgi:hypothetical protein
MPVVHLLPRSVDLLDEFPKLRNTPHSAFSPGDDVVDCDHARRAN